MIALVSSCKEEDRLSVQDSKDITEEALTDSYFQDMDDMAGVAVETPSEVDYAGARGMAQFEVDDNRFQCGGDPILVTIQRLEGSTKEHPIGEIIVDFGATGCTDLRQNTRTGKLIFRYNGKRFVAGSTIITTTENYTINGIKLEGKRTLTNVTTSTTQAPKFNVVLEDGEATFEDGTVATRESNITWSWIRAASPLNDQLVIDQASVANGTTRGGRAYEVSLLEELVYKRFCGIAVSGIKKYVIDGEKEITVDYGDGECDKIIKVSVNGTTKTVNLD
jgi:hypothetical protein